jgi:hypothetical protein
MVSCMEGLKANELARDGCFADAAKAFVEEWGNGVSVVEIRRFLEPYMPTTGTVSLSSARDPNIILWTGMSQEFADALEAVLNSPDISVTSGQFLCYLADGGALTLPIVNRPPKGGYKKPHWLPVVFTAKNRPPRRPKPTQA